MTTDDLIDRLGRNTTAVPRLPAPGARTAGWVLWCAVYFAAALLISVGLMQRDLVAMTPLYVIQLGAALVLGLAAARAALGSVVPGASTNARVVAGVAAVLWVGSLVSQSAIGLPASGTAVLPGGTDWPCVAAMTVGGLVLGAPLVWMLRRGAPLTPRTTALLAGLAVLSVANIEACLTRPHESAMTILVWHGGTMVIATALLAATSRRWLTWPTRLTRPGLS